MPSISPSHRDRLETPHTAAVATVGADGQPQVTAIWAMLDGDVVRTSLSMTSRISPRRRSTGP